MVWEDPESEEAIEELVDNSEKQQQEHGKVVIRVMIFKHIFPRRFC